MEVPYNWRTQTQTNRREEWCYRKKTVAVLDWRITRRPHNEQAWKTLPFECLAAGSRHFSAPRQQTFPSIKLRQVCSADSRRHRLSLLPSWVDHGGNQDDRFVQEQSRNIQKCCKMLLEDFDGEVPRTLEELTKLAWRRAQNSECRQGAVASYIQDLLYLAERINQSCLRIAPCESIGSFEVEEILYEKNTEGAMVRCPPPDDLQMSTCCCRNPKCDVCLLRCARKAKNGLGLKCKSVDQSILQHP